MKRCYSPLSSVQEAVAAAPTEGRWWLVPWSQHAPAHSAPRDCCTRSLPMCEVVQVVTKLREAWGVKRRLFVHQAAMTFEVWTAGTDPLDHQQAEKIPCQSRGPPERIGGSHISSWAVLQLCSLTEGYWAAAKVRCRNINPEKCTKSGNLSISLSL